MQTVHRRGGARRPRALIVTIAVSLLAIATFPAGAGAGDRRADELISAERFLTQLFTISPTSGPAVSPLFEFRFRCPKVNDTSFYGVHMDFITTYADGSTSTGEIAGAMGLTGRGVVDGPFVVGAASYLTPGPYTVTLVCVVPHADERDSVLTATRTFCVTDPVGVESPCGPARRVLVHPLPDLSNVAKLTIERIAEQVVATPPTTAPGECPEGTWSLDFVATQYVRPEGEIDGAVHLAILHDGTWSFSGGAYFGGGYGFRIDSRGTWSRGSSADVVTFAGPFGAGTSLQGGSAVPVPGAPGDYTAACEGDRLTLTGPNGFPVIFNKEGGS